MPPSAQSMIQVGLDVLRTVRDDTTKSILAFLGDVVGATGDDATPGASDGENAEWWQHVGFVSRPPKPERGKAACKALVYRQSDHDVVFGSKDLRGQALAGSLQDGETCVYAPGSDGNGQARVLLKAGGDVYLYTRKGNVESGGGITVQLDAANDTIRIVNSVGNGLIIDANGVSLVAKGKGAVTISDDTKVISVGGTAQVDGTTVVLGSTAVPVANAALKGPSGVLGSPSLKVLIE